MLEKMISPFRTFRAKVTVILTLAIVFSLGISDLLIYEYSNTKQFQQLRHKLKVIAHTASLLIDGNSLKNIPLNKDGVNTPQYKTIADGLMKIGSADPAIAYVYVLKKTDKKDKLQFIIDLQTKSGVSKKPPALPGEIYDVSSSPELVEAFISPMADNDLVPDEWGVFLSGYSPVRDSQGNVIAILGVDIAAEDVYNLKKEIRVRVGILLALGIVIAILVGISISGSVAKPIRSLLSATRHVAKGNFDYKVKIKGADEITELANSFNKMSSDLNLYMNELKRTTTENERFLKELEIAKNIQKSFLPESVPILTGVDIAVSATPARAVGGDFYDFIPLNDNRWGIVIADVSGKGVPASLFMALSQTLMRAIAKSGVSALDMIAQTNNLLLEYSRTSMFVTAFYAVLDMNERTIEYISAGHNPGILLKKPSGEMVLLEAQGMPLGLVPDIEIASRKIDFNKGEAIVLYTDGVTESINSNKEQFGIDRLKDVVIKDRDLASQCIVNDIVRAMDEFTSKEPQFDDITIMAIKAV